MTPDEPRFTAFALDALPAAERHDVEVDVWADADLRRECEETAAFARKLKQALSIELNASLTDEHWREIHAEAAVIGFSSSAPVALPKHSRFPGWAIPAAAGVLFGAIVTSVALTWSDGKSAVVALPPSPQPKPAVASELPKPVVNPVSRAAVNAPAVAVDSTPLAKSSAPELVTPVRLPAPIPSVQPAVALASAEPRGTIEPPQQPQPLARFVSFSDGGQDSRLAAPAPALSSAQQTVPVLASSRSFESAGVSFDAPLIAYGAGMPSFPPLSYIPAVSGISGGSSAPAVSVPPSVFVPDAGQPGTGLGGTRPNPPAGEPVTEVPPATTPPPPVETIAWRRPQSNDSEGATGGARGPQAGETSSDPSLELLRLDTGMFPTLEYLCTVLEHDTSVHENGDGEHSTPILKGAPAKVAGPTEELFCFRDAPEIKVRVLLDNGGAPVSETPGNTRVLSISAPFIGAP